MVSTDGVGVAVGAFLAGVADAGVVQLAQESWSMKHKADCTVQLPTCPFSSTTAASKCVCSVMSLSRLLENEM